MQFVVLDNEILVRSRTVSGDARIDVIFLIAADMTNQTKHSGYHQSAICIDKEQLLVLLQE